MPRYVTNQGERFNATSSNGESRPAVTQTALDRFTPSILGLGDIGRRATSIEAICATFDLAGFTDFCRQVDPHLAVPTFLKLFLDWLFVQIRDVSVCEKTTDGAIMYTRLPFLAKFMGDGVMFLWDVDDIGDEMAGVLNIPIQTYAICTAYRRDFLPTIHRKVSYPPTALRCGMARGRVHSVGDGDDFVGPCINIAARLQKLVPGITYCFSHRGLDLEIAPAELQNRWLLKRIEIRGIGSDELVYVRRKEFESLDEEVRAFFADP